MKIEWEVAHLFHCDVIFNIAKRVEVFFSSCRKFQNSVTAGISSYVHTQSYKSHIHHITVLFAAHSCCFNSVVCCKVCVFTTTVQPHYCCCGNLTGKFWIIHTIVWSTEVANSAICCQRKSLISAIAEILNSFQSPVPFEYSCLLE